MAKITAPLEGFDGYISDVQFKDSVAVTDDVAVIGYCQSAGYLVEFDEGPTVLKGAELEAALDEAGLSKAGTADEKRARLAEHQGE